MLLIRQCRGSRDPNERPSMPFTASEADNRGLRTWEGKTVVRGMRGKTAIDEFPCACVRFCVKSERERVFGERERERERGGYTFFTGL